MMSYTLHMVYTHTICSLIPRPPCPAFVAQVAKAGRGSLGTRLHNLYLHPSLQGQKWLVAN